MMEGGPPWCKERIQRSLGQVGRCITPSLEIRSFPKRYDPTALSPVPTQPLCPRSVSSGSATTIQRKATHTMTDAFMKCRQNGAMTVWVRPARTLGKTPAMPRTARPASGWRRGSSSSRSCGPAPRPPERAATQRSARLPRRRSMLCNTLKTSIPMAAFRHGPSVLSCLFKIATAG